jgi:hypothetical protein
MNGPTIVLMILLIASTNVSQTRRSGSQKKPSKVSVQTATTKDGRTVLLKSDGTWEYADDPIATPTPSDSPAVGSASSAAPQSGSLSLEAALVFRSGDVKPMARIVFYLMDDDLAKILRSAGLKPSQRYGRMEDTDQNLLFTFGSARKYPSLEHHEQFNSTATEALKAHIKQSITTDFSGKAIFQNVPTGSYFLMGFGVTPRGFVVWNIGVEIKPGSTSITLDQNNAAFAN